MSEETLIDEDVGVCRMIRSERKTLGISVLPCGSVELAAPENADIPEIAKRLKKRKSWIRRQRREFAEMNVARPPLRYCSGATHRYIGKQYRIKVVVSEKEEVKLRGSYFWVYWRKYDEEKVESLLADWYREHAKSQFERRLGSWRSWCQRRKLPVPELHLRKMRKRWGSSHQDGRILLNPKLVRMPSICIDYVIAHEICHLMFPHHDRKFYRLLGEVFPSWKSVKQKLESSEL